MNKNLSNLGYRMPAEWEKQEAIWITWPYNKKDWPDLFESIPVSYTHLTLPTKA